MGEDGRRPHDEPADADEPLQSPSDDNESDSGDFVFPDDADEDFVFSDDPTDVETSNDSDNILSPVTDPDTNTRDNDNRGANNDESRDPSQPLSDLNEGRFDADPDRTTSDSTSRRATDDRESWDRRSDSGDPATEPGASASGPSDSTSDSNTPGEERSEKGSESNRRSTGPDVPWRTDPRGGNSDRDSSSASDSGPSVSPYPDSDRKTAASDDSMTAIEEEPARAETTAPTKSDGGTLTTGDTPVSDPSTDNSLVPDGPVEDQEMPLGDHIEEMVRRVLVVVAVMSVVSVAVFPFGDQLINFIWYRILRTASADVAPRVYHPLSPLLARLKVSTLGGFVIALPVFVYQTYRFMRPGLYPRERRYYIASIPTSLVLAALGVAFAFLVVLPLIFIYFLVYSQGAAQIAFGLSETFGLMLLLMGFFALIFQIPLFIMLAVMMGVTSREWLTERRLYFWGGFLGVAFLTNPDPTGMAPFIVASSMVVLFEATLLVLRWTDR